jgi:hypothetical protein
VLVDEVLDLANGITHSESILSVGVDAGNPAVLYYEPQGSAVDQVPTTRQSVAETFAEYRIDPGADNDFLEIMLARLEAHYGLTGFAAVFTADFEAFLQSVDLDDQTEGNQPYTDPSGDPILTLADTRWFGPAETWPKELENHPYIHFWHRLDTALIEQGIPGMGYEVLGDEEWLALFDPGPLSENPYITMEMRTRSTSGFDMLDEDQLENERPERSLGDIGAIELLDGGSPVVPQSAESPRETRAPRPRVRPHRQ